MPAGTQPCAAGVYCHLRAGGTPPACRKGWLGPRRARQQLAGAAPVLRLGTLLLLGNMDSCNPGPGDLPESYLVN